MNEKKCVCRERDGAKSDAAVVIVATGWRPIEAIPHEMEIVLAINSNGCQAVINMIGATGVGHFIDDDGAHPRLSCITHWMPLPEPPERMNAAPGEPK